MALATPMLVWDWGWQSFGTHLGCCKALLLVVERQVPFAFGVPQPGIRSWCSFALGAELSPLLLSFAKPNLNKLAQMATNPFDDLQLLHVPTPQGNSSFASTL